MLYAFVYCFNPKCGVDIRWPVTRHVGLAPSCAAVTPWMLLFKEMWVVLVLFPANVRALRQLRIVNRLQHGNPL